MCVWCNTQTCIFGGRGAEAMFPCIYDIYQHLKHIQIQLYNIWIVFSLILMYLLLWKDCVNCDNAGHNARYAKIYIANSPAAHYLHHLQFTIIIILIVVVVHTNTSLEMCSNYVSLIVQLLLAVAAVIARVQCVLTTES